MEQFGKASSDILGILAFVTGTFCLCLYAPLVFVDYDVWTPLSAANTQRSHDMSGEKEQQVSNPMIDGASKQSELIVLVVVSCIVVLWIKTMQRRQKMDDVRLGEAIVQEPFSPCATVEYQCM